MKRSILILLAGVIGIAVIWFFRPKPTVVNEVAIPQPIQTNMTPVLVVKNPPIETITQAPPAIIATTESKKPLDVLKAQSLADWTNVIPNIKLWSHFRTRSSWVADQRDTNNYPVILLTGVNGKTIQYKAKLTSVDAMGDRVREIQLQSGWMNIADTRSLGDSLLQMMGKDTASFDAWCNKVGNNWIDQPEWTSGGLRMPDGNKFYGFATHITFNNESPWYVDFFVSDP